MSYFSSQRLLLLLCTCANQIQNMMLAPALITLASFILNIGLNAVLISALGFRGAPLATSLSRVTQAVLLALFVWRLEGKKAKGKDVVMKEHAAPYE